MPKILNAAIHIIGKGLRTFCQAFANTLAKAWQDAGKPLPENYSAEGFSVMLP